MLLLETYTNEQRLMHTEMIHISTDTICDYFYKTVPLQMFLLIHLLTYTHVSNVLCLVCYAGELFETHPTITKLFTRQNVTPK